MRSAKCAKHPLVMVRQARREDAPAMARAWCDAGRLYVSISPQDFQVPDEDGLVEWLEFGIDAMESDRDLALLVAELGDEVAGWVSARLVTPASDAQWQL